MITVAATQFACTADRVANLQCAERMVRVAQQRGAQIVLLQELFETPYFCKDHDLKHFDLALPIADNPAIQRMRQLAAELKVVLPVSVFERAGKSFFNSVAIIDADGALLGVYRKAHIPESPGYHEKFFFSPGDAGFRVWHTKYGVIGVGICWDQWFPECARIMALKGAELLLYPTAIGEEPQDKSIDSQPHWQRTMQGHAAANIMPVIAANRIGVEKGTQWQVQYYGSSFITDHTGAIVQQSDRVSEGVITASVDLEAIRLYRESWGVFRDRRVDLYGPLLTFDGEGELGNL